MPRGLRGAARVGQAHNPPPTACMLATPRVPPHSCRASTRPLFTSAATCLPHLQTPAGRWPAQGHLAPGEATQRSRSRAGGARRWHRAQPQCRCCLQGGSRQQGRAFLSSVRSARRLGCAAVRACELQHSCAAPGRRTRKREQPVGASARLAPLTVAPSVWQLPECGVLPLRQRVHVALHRAPGRPHEAEAEAVVLHQRRGAGTTA